MIVHIIERFHDHQEEVYDVNTEELDPKNPIDALVLKKCRNKGFDQEVYVDVTAMQAKEPDSEFWESPADAGYCRKFKRPKDVNPEKVVRLRIYYDC